MEVRWTDSAQEHGIPRAQILYAISHAIGVCEIEGLPNEVTQVFVGYSNEVDQFLLEVIVAHRPGRYLRIFHANHLTDKFRNIIERTS